MSNLLTVGIVSPPAFARRTTTARTDASSGVIGRTRSRSVFDGATWSIAVSSPVGAVYRRIDKVRQLKEFLNAGLRCAGNTSITAQAQNASLLDAMQAQGLAGGQLDDGRGRESAVAVQSIDGATRR